MGSMFSSTEYNLDDHGHSTREVYDSYVSGDKFADLSGKVVGITGTSAGSLGFHVAEVAIKKNAKILLLLNRNSGSAKKGQEGLEAIAKESGSPTQVQVVTIDMQDLETVKKAGEEVNKIASKNGGLDVLVCNAGIMATKDCRTKDGFEVQMQTNQLSHFLLSQITFPSLKMAAEKRGEARIVTHSSGARDNPAKKLEGPFFLKCDEGTLGGDKNSAFGELLFGYGGPWSRYHQTKLANSCFAMAVHHKCKAAGLNIKGVTSEPGVASSNLQVTSTRGDGLMPGWMAKMLMGTGHSAEDGSLSCALAAFGKDTASGDMYAPETGLKGPPVKCISEGVAVKKGKEKLTLDEDNIKNIWSWCEEGLGIKFDI